MSYKLNSDSEIVKIFCLLKNSYYGKLTNLIKSRNTSITNPHGPKFSIWVALYPEPLSLENSILSKFCP